MNSITEDLRDLDVPRLVDTKYCRFLFEEKQR
jgi:hypothetical protein